MYTDFVLNPDYESYVQTNGQTSPKSLYPITLFTLTGLGLVIAGFIAAGGYEVRMIYYVIAVILAAITLSIFVIQFRRLNDEQHLFKEGTLILATLVSIEVNEYLDAQKAYRDLLSLISFVFDTIDVFSNASPSRKGTAASGYSRDNLYEVIVTITALTPKGTPLTITAKKNRPDLRGQILPKTGDKLAVLYLDDAHYKLM